MRGTHELQGADRGPSQDRRNRASGGYSLPGERKERDRSRRENKVSEARVSHSLEREAGRSSRDTKRRRSSEGHSRTEEDRGREKSGHGKKASE